MVSAAPPTSIERRLPELRCPECRERMTAEAVIEHGGSQPPTIRYRCTHPDCGSTECLVTSL